jgi:DNA-binding NarL/FixJ family response regulator
MDEALDHPIRVLVVDDQPLVRTGNALVLDTADDIDVVGEAADGLEAITLSAELMPDVVLMDVRMPGMDGIQATKAITTSQPSTRVVVFTTFDLDEYAFGALDAGASAFLLKSTAPEVLTQAVRTVASGESVVEPRITSKLIDHYVGRPERTVSNAHTALLESLTPREHDIFIAMSRGLSNQEISLYLHLAPSSVKTYVNRVFSKLGVRDRVQAVILAHAAGVLTDVDADS